MMAKLEQIWTTFDGRAFANQRDAVDHEKCVYLVRSLVASGIDESHAWGIARGLLKDWIFARKESAS